MKTEFKIQIRTIKFLERYFRENFYTDTEELDTFKYALEAYEYLVDDIDNTITWKEFEYWTGLKTYADWEKYFETASLIDSVIDIFERR
jgi:hypothetical protein